MTRTLSTLCLLAALPAFAHAAEPTVTAKKTKDHVEFTSDGQLVTRYHVGEAVAKPYLWPLNAPGGVPVTRGWPMQTGLPKETKDHVHQKSAWFCHGDVIPDGIELKQKVKGVKGVDFWSETPNHGKIVCVSVGEPTAERNMAWVATKNEWRTADGVKIMDEDRTVTVRDLGDARLVILDIDLHASVCPITFGDTKEGSMGIRVNDEFRLALTPANPAAAVTSADGSTARAPARDNLPMWGKRSDWHDYSGSVDGKPVGIALFDHPKNSPRAAWHTRAYGLMAANPFGRASFPGLTGDEAKLAKGESLKLRYGILVHGGDAKDGKVAERYAAFAKE
jgi:hypothetical protein